jgi:antitoxin component of MazEF toxin-antitoxin module
MEELEATNITTSYEVTKDNLKVIKTPEKIVPIVEQYDLNEIRNQIARIDGAIELWNAKRKPLQDIIDKYEEIKPEVFEEDIIKDEEIVEEIIK